VRLSAPEPTSEKAASKLNVTELELAKIDVEESKIGVLVAKEFSTSTYSMDFLYKGANQAICDSV